jgi:hypothetical protein
MDRQIDECKELSQLSTECPQKIRQTEIIVVTVPAPVSPQGAYRKFWGWGKRIYSFWGIGEY